MSNLLRLRKQLALAPAVPIWPLGAHPLALADTVPLALHAILSVAYQNGFGAVAPFEQWWTALIADSESDPSLVFIAGDDNRQPIGVCLCWTSGFIKDLAVLPQWRGRRIGEALLAEAFQAFHQRGLHHVDLKVVAANAPAVALYHRVGMVEAAPS